MSNNLLIKKCLVESGAYKDLEVPVILTSGAGLTPFFINAEKLCCDENISEVLKNYADDSRKIIDYCVRLSYENPEFKKIIDIITEKARSLFPNLNQGECVISGGQRRDWVFSGPVADNLGLRHISLYKNERTELLCNESWIRNKSKKEKEFSKFDNNVHVVHIVDLLTKGSSCYRVENGSEKGWVPMIMQCNAKINNLVAVVTRLQGGEERLKSQGVNVHSFVSIDEKFLKKYSKQPDVVVDYLRDGRLWTEIYLLNQGVDFLVSYFEPENPKLDRGRKFLKNYDGFLKENGFYRRLEKLVYKEYETSLKEIIQN